MFPSLGSLTGGGGFQGGGSSAASGPADGYAGSGNTTVNFAPPKTTNDVLTNPLLIIGGLAVLYLVAKKK